MKTELEWRELFDDHDNSYWEASGPYTDEDGSPEFNWRIRQRLEGNLHVFCDDSDAELRLNEFEADKFMNLDLAKAKMLESHNEILKVCKQESSGLTMQTSDS